jgi:hypothetical protein
MKILGYGEDALTLWVLKNRLSVLLEKLNDSSSLSQCKVFFRPSFGRSGGDNSAQFGEFDFILLSKDQLYLGESKWHRSSENITNGILELRKEQLSRHSIFKLYVKEWAFGNYASWDEFEKTAKISIDSWESCKPIAPNNSLLACNLITILNIIRHHFETLPSIKNVLLYLHDCPDAQIHPKSAGLDFEFVTIDCSEGAVDNFVVL